MATSDVAICNSALIKVGADRIISLNDDSPAGRVCKEQYPKVLKELLRSHPWHFAIKRAELVASLTPPVFDYTYAFTLPNDYLRVLEVEDQQYIRWAKEGNVLVSDSETMRIKYISSNVLPGNFDATFDEALATLLASDIAYTLVQSIQLRDTLRAEAKEKVAQARSFDSQEGSTRQVIANDYLYSRY